MAGDGLPGRPAERRAVRMDLDREPAGLQVARGAHLPTVALTFWATIALTRPSAAFSAS